LSIASASAAPGESIDGGGADATSRSTVLIRATLSRNCG
jgi:hypothetical protein